ncbi:MAG: flagellar motor switch protein FliM [Sphingobium sp.]
MDDVQSCVFGRGEPQAPVMLSGLDRLGEQLGRRIRALIEPISGVRPHVESHAGEVVAFAHWADQLPAFTSISGYRLQPLKGQVLVRMDAPMISTLVDYFYGGAGDRPLPARGEFTPTEDRLIARLADSLIARLVDIWRDMVPLDAALVMRETGLGFASAAQPTDQMLLQRFTLSLTRDRSWPIDILFPLSALRGVDALTGAKPQGSGEDDVDPAWRDRVARRMRDIRLPARTVLARPHLSLADLLQLKVGDIIPVTIARNLPLIVGDRIVAHGTIGEQDGRAAFQIEKLAQEPDQ